MYCQFCSKNNNGYGTYTVYFNGGLIIGLRCGVLAYPKLRDGSRDRHSELSNKSYVLPIPSTKNIRVLLAKSIMADAAEKEKAEKVAAAKKRV